MKKLCIVSLALCLSGCATVSKLSEALSQQELEPGEQIVLADENNDGKADVAIVAKPNSSGHLEAVIDADTGRPVEVKNSRQILMESDVQDEWIAANASGWAAIFGIPAAAGIGALIRTLKPSRKLSEAMMHYKSLVSVIQKAREDPDYDTAGFDKAMDKMQPDELKISIKKVKADAA